MTSAATQALRVQHPAMSAQDGQLTLGARIKSIHSLYQVDAFLGQGTFGKVLKCTRMSDNTTVAVKMIRDEGVYGEQAKQELAALKKLSVLDPDKSNIVRWYQHFISRGHICLMFEQLDKNLSDFMKERRFQPLPLKEIRPIVQQLSVALEYLKIAGIIHADLKTDNIMLVNHATKPYRVKLIDFGLACEVSAAKTGSYIQTCPFRAPEIILGLPYTEAIDMWSLGCVVAYLYLGSLLYPGVNQYDMMRYIVETQGLPPDNVLTSGRNTSQFFQRFYRGAASVWKLKRPEQYQSETGIHPIDTRKLKLRSLNDLLSFRVIDHEDAAERAAEKCDRMLFVDMLKRMLQLDAAERITPHQLLKHEFITMCRIISLTPISSYVGSSMEAMIDPNQIEASDIEAVCGSQPQPPTRPAQPVRDNPPPPPPAAAGSSVVQSHSVARRPCTGAQSMTSDRSGMKRKADYEDGGFPGTSLLPKKIKYGSTDHQRSSAAPANPGSTASRSHCSQTQSMVRSGTKRKTCDGEDTGREETTSDPRDRKRFRQGSPDPAIPGCSSWTQRSDFKGKRDRSYDCDSLHVQPNKRRTLVEHHSRSSHTSMAVGKDTSCQKTTSDTSDRRVEDRKRRQQSPPLPAIPGCSSWTHKPYFAFWRSPAERHCSEVRSTSSRHSSVTQRSDRDRRRDRGYNRDSPLRGRSGCRSPSEHRSRSSHTSKAVGQGTGCQKTTSDPSDRRVEDRKRRQQSPPLPAIPGCSSWTHKPYFAFWSSPAERHCSEVRSTSSRRSSATQRSERDRRRDRGYNRDSPLRGRSGCRSPSEHRSRSSHTSKAVGQGTGCQKTTSDPSDRRNEDRKRRQQSPPLPAIPGCSSWTHKPYFAFWSSPAERRCSEVRSTSSRRSSATQRSDRDRRRDRGYSRFSPPRGRSCWRSPAERHRSELRSTSSRSSGTRGSDRDRRRDRSDNCDNPHRSDLRSPAERNRHSPHTSVSTVAKSQSPQKTEAADEEDVQPSRRPYGHWSDNTRRRASEQDRKRRADLDSAGKRLGGRSRDSPSHRRESSERPPSLPAPQP